MGRNNDYTGVDQTCPLIDNVRDFIEGIGDDDTGYGLKNGIKESCQVLEKIRQMNSDLRDFGNKQARDLEEMERERDYYRDRSETFESEAKYLENELKQLQ